MTTGQAQHHHQVRELIHAAAQEANILPREARNLETHHGRFWDQVF